MKNYKNYEDSPVPLPRLRVNEAIEPVHLFMLFVMWFSGITVGSIGFLIELGLGVKGRRGSSIIE